VVHHGFDGGRSVGADFVGADHEGLPIDELAFDQAALAKGVDGDFGFAREDFVAALGERDAGDGGKDRSKGGALVGSGREYGLVHILSPTPLRERPVSCRRRGIDVSCLERELDGHRIEGEVAPGARVPRMGRARFPSSPGS
jgi:hypothetical protein